METNLRKKVAVLFICLNAPYWEYAKDAIEGAQKFLLPDHDKDFFLWSDMPEDVSYGATVFPTEPATWPFPTLMRYHLFLQQAEILKTYDYIFYCDIDMRFVDVVGNEILGDGLTAVQHPMYAIRNELKAPYEPNPRSTAYISLPMGYFAGGFQGGKADKFLAAMSVLKNNIDTDFNGNYVARWNDESHWNRYLYDNPPGIILDPAYVYPDSLIEVYYEKVWGRKIKPKLITLTKKFTVSKEGGDAVKNIVDTI